MEQSIVQIAEQLNGSEYGEKLLSKVDLPKNMVVISWYSDDNIEIEWLITDEVWAWKWKEFYILPEKLCIITDSELQSIPDLLSQFNQWAIDLIEEATKNVLQRKPKIEAKRDHDGYSWYITVSWCNVAYFDVMEDGDKFCRGAVIDLSQYLK